MNSTHCPQCNHDIGFWPIVRAPLPNRLKCPHCKAKLKYVPTGWRLLLVCTLLSLPLIVLSAYYLLTQIDLDGYIRYGLYALSLVVIWSPFEWFIATRLRAKHELVLDDPLSV